MSSVNRAVLLGALLPFVCAAARASGRLTDSVAADLYPGLGRYASAFHRDAELLPVRLVFSYVRKDGRAVWPNAFSISDSER